MLFKIAIGILAVLFLILQFGPREPVDLAITFSPEDLGEDLDEYLASSEATVENLNPLHAKSISWAGSVGERTPLSIVYLHGFSATKEEIRPVPDDVAKAVEANVYYARLTGHGRDGIAMTQASVNDWLNDTAEAIAIGERLGEKVIVISTSTGGTLFTAYGINPDNMANVAGAIMMSPNFRIAASGSQILTLPFARHVVPLLTGKERSWEPKNDAQALHWTTQYPTTAVLPVAAAVNYVADLPVETMTVPTFFIYSPDDQVVSAQTTADVMKRWGGPTESLVIKGSAVGDGSAHVLAGDIVSPQTNDLVTRAMIEWIEGL